MIFYFIRRNYWEDNRAGFSIACQKDIHMDQNLATQLYKEHEGKEFYDTLIAHMTRFELSIYSIIAECCLSNLWIDLVWFLQYVAYQG